jgi:hypothetical protein
LVKIPSVLVFGLWLRRIDIAGAFLAGYLDGLLRYEKNLLVNGYADFNDKGTLKG